MPILTFFYIFLLALITSLLIIPPISRLAVGMGILDRPDQRKVHLDGTPRLGGIAIVLAFMLAVFTFSEIGIRERGFMTGGVIMFLVGLADDLIGLNPRQKFTGQIIASLAAMLIGGFRIDSLGNLFGTGEIVLGIFALPFTLLAIVGVTNAINLLDGLDGLAGGVSAIAVATIGILAYTTQNFHLLAMTVALLGAVLGFLRYNSYPATIFMGDAGSLFLGYCMGLFSVMLVADSWGAIGAAVPLLILAVPVIDTLFVMMKRLKQGRNPFHPDNNHIHHRFLDLGVGHTFTVIVVYTFSYVMAALAGIFHRLPNYRILLLLLFAYMTVYLIIREFTRLVGRKRGQLIQSNQSLRDTRFFRRMVYFSHHLMVWLKYLIITALSLTLFLPSSPATETRVICLILLSLTGALLFMTGRRENRFLLFILYFDGAFIIYQMENLGRAFTVLSIPVLVLSHGAFLLLFVLTGVKVFMRNRTREMIGSPIDYLILFIVLSVPLLPMAFTSRYHLLTVAGKSVILFLAYKLILMRQARRNRKIIVATLAALLFIGVKGFF